MRGKRKNVVWRWNFVIKQWIWECRGKFSVVSVVYGVIWQNKIASERKIECDKWINDLYESVQSEKKMKSCSVHPRLCWSVACLIGCAVLLRDRWSHVPIHPQCWSIASLIGYMYVVLLHDRWSHVPIHPQCWSVACLIGCAVLLHDRWSHVPIHPQCWSVACLIGCAVLLTW